MTGNEIAQRALAQVGTPFRLRGRQAGVALDCVGLALVALGPLAGESAENVSYSMRGDYRADIARFFRSPRFRHLADIEPLMDGDIVLVLPAPSQLHLIIAAMGCFVHAHAGLRRVVHGPAFPDWQILDRWRVVGG
jgi:hypothetical protein